MTRGQALHLGDNEPPTLALMYPKQILQDRDGSAGRLGVQGCKKTWGDVISNQSSSLGNE